MADLFPRMAVLHCTSLGRTVRRPPLARGARADLLFHFPRWTVSHFDVPPKVNPQRRSTECREMAEEDLQAYIFCLIVLPGLHQTATAIPELFRLAVLGQAVGKRGNQEE